MESNYWGEPFAEAYCSNNNHLPVYRIACGILRTVETMPIYIDVVDKFAGHPFPQTIIRYHYGSGITVNHDLAKRIIEKNTDPKITQKIQEILDYFENETTHKKISELLTQEQNRTGHMKVYWGGGWGGHTLLDYDCILKLGTSGLKRKIIARMEHITSNEEHELLSSLLVICKAFETFATRFADAVKQLIETSENGNLIKELSIMESILRKVPLNPAKTWREALQCFRLVFCFDGIDSPGRFDQYMYPYLAASLESGEIDETSAQVLLENIWVFFEKERAWNLCIGGQKPDGSDATNDLSYMILDTAKKYKFRAPNLTMRCHDKTPEKLWDKAMETVKTGIGMPALYNDKAVIDVMLNYDMPVEDARDYAMNGCNQIDIQGKSNMGLEDGELNLLKCFELALNAGICPLTGERLGPDTKDPESFTDFKQVMDAYKEQVEYFTNLMIDSANKSQLAYAKFAPDPFRTLLISDCIENAREFRNGGARYNHGQILTEGIANTADSLYAVKYLVFDTELLTIKKLLEILKLDFKGYENIQAMIKNRCQHYGNDQDEVDKIACEIIDHFYGILAKHKTYRGGLYGGGCSTFTRAPIYGRFVGATPDGRSSKTPVSDSVGSCQGMDVSGPTALLKSVSKIHHKYTSSGYVLNLKFSKDLMKDSETTHKMKTLIKTFFKTGGQQVQINIVNAQELLEAKKNPDAYKNLIVRVGGYSAYFTQLPSDLQDDVIARKMHDL